ncbi:membrane protein [Microvirga vignae]|uniref:Membrane protein n=1 Tax=Microvirga vignae TaxID=1225564 RepID=A0A0H1REK9_9HYPH|nr:cytochrome c oxidase assembly protein [Microvirga vignae]KLK93628.1 membrane protein [Microvirga vignae]
MRAAAIILALITAAEAQAHSGHVHWLDMGTTWTWNPWVTIPMLLSGGFYIAGLARLWQRAGIGRGVRLWQAGCFFLGWVLLVVALVTPLHWLGERLFTAHMIEHEILMALAAPLLVVGRPVVMLWALSSPLRRGVGGVSRMSTVAGAWGWLTNPPIATLLHGAALWSWHAPELYEAALTDPWIHWLQHLSFFLTAIVFWRALLQGREEAYGAAVFYLFITSLHTGFLGILLAFFRRTIYPTQTLGAAEWGLTPLEDQQLAGLFMWIPAGIVYAGAALILAGLWIARSGASRSRGGQNAYAPR